MGQDQVAPGVLSALFGVSNHILLSSMANVVEQVCSCWVVVGIEVVWLHVPHIACWVDKAVQRTWNGHGTPIVADKEAKGTPLAGVTPNLKSVLYVPDKV